MENNFQIGSINNGNTMTILDAIYGQVPNDVRGFLHQPYVNATHEGESIGRALNRQEMELLRNEIKKVVQDFGNVKRNILASSLLLNNEQQQLAAMIYVYNHILKNVQYADVQFFTDGHTQNRPGDTSIYTSAFSALVTRRSICCGISDAIFLLCSVLNIPCEKWLTPGGGHAFNKVKLGNVWYKVDATFQIGFYPHARANGWDTSYFLTATQQPNGLSYRNYPLNQIQFVKSILERFGVNFIYETPPQIVINTLDNAIEKITNEKTVDGDTLLCNLYNSINEAIASTNIEDGIKTENPSITIHQRSDAPLKPQIRIQRRSDHPTITINQINDSISSEIPHIVFYPNKKMITINHINYKIHVLSVNTNNNYIINIISPSGTQQTYLTNTQGIIIEKLVRGLSFINNTFHPINSDNPPRLSTRHL